MGRRVTLRSRIALESLAPASIRWLRENQGKHACQCGCGEPIRLEARHCWRGAPRYVHGHQNRRGHWRVLQLRQAGCLTTSEVARALGIGITTLRRREGTVYPRATRIGGIRVYRSADLPGVPVTNLIRAPEAGAPDHYGVNVWAEPARPGGRGATVALMR